MSIKKRYIALGLLAFAAAAVAHFPAKWAAAATAPELPAVMAGTVWKGHIERLNGLPPIAFKISPLALLRGAAPVSFNGDGNGISIAGEAGIGRVDTLTINGNALFLSQIDNRLSALSGEFTLDATDLGFDGNCEKTRGTVKTDILTRNASVWLWKGPTLSGPITCENNVLSAVLSGTIPGQSVEAILKVFVNGSYQIRAVINTNTAEAGLVLPLYGFEQKGERFTLNEQGRWM